MEDEPGGLAALRAIRDGDRPQIALGSIIGFRLIQAEPGRVAFESKLSEAAANSNGVIHGGVLGLVLDQAVGDAVRTLLPDGVGYATADLFLSYLAPVRPGETVVYEAWVTHRANSTIRVRGRAVREDEEVCECMATLRVVSRQEKGRS